MAFNDERKIKLYKLLFAQPNILLSNYPKKSGHSWRSTKLLFLTSYLIFLYKAFAFLHRAFLFHIPYNFIHFFAWTKINRQKKFQRKMKSYTTQFFQIIKQFSKEDLSPTAPELDRKQSWSSTAVNHLRTFYLTW